jgi:tetratricopeptide (TPR) repeat protein
MASIALNLIMKDEAAVLPRLLESVYPLLDRYAVVDTGSCDDSIRIVREFFAARGIPGEIRGHPFRDFADARNAALDLLAGQADYGVWIDCDEQLLLPPAFDAAAFRAGLGDCDLYSLTVLADQIAYPRACIFRCDKPFRWQGVVHERLLCDDPVTPCVRDEPKVKVNADGKSWSEGLRIKYLGHAQLLENAYARDDDPRDLFYLAQSYRDAGEYGKALICYRERTARTDGYDEERYYAQFMAGLMCERLRLPLDAVIGEYLKASVLDPDRAEHLLNVLLLLQGAGRWQAAERFGDDLLKRYHRRSPYPRRSLFVDESTYDWKLQQAHQATLAFLAGAQ